jgi:hypothetical protein
MWEINDKYNYDLHNKHKLGQIKNDELSKDIQQYACNLNYKFCNYLLIHYDITKKRYNVKTTFYIIFSIFLISF